MSKENHDIPQDISQLAEDARALLVATADVAGDKVGAARQRLSAALERGKELACQVREKAAAGVKAADKAVHEHPYQAMGIALGVGVLIGFLVARRSGSKRD